MIAIRFYNDQDHTCYTIGVTLSLHFHVDPRDKYV